MYVQNFTSFCQVLKRCTQKEISSFFCLMVKLNSVYAVLIDFRAVQSISVCLSVTSCHY